MGSRGRRRDIRVGTGTRRHCLDFRKSDIHFSRHSKQLHAFIPNSTFPSTYPCSLVPTFTSLPKSHVFDFRNLVCLAGGKCKFFHSKMNGFEINCFACATAKIRITVVKSVFCVRGDANAFARLLKLPYACFFLVTINKTTEHLKLKLPRFLWTNLCNGKMQLAAMLAKMRKSTDSLNVCTCFHVYSGSIRE